MKLLSDNNRFGNTIYWLATFFVIALSGFAIFYQLGVRSLWYDEVRTILHYAPHPFRITNGDPPFWPLITHYILRHSHSEFWLRFPNALVFMASTAFIAIGYRKFVGKNIAFLAALTLATSYFALSKYQLARPYAFFTFFTIVSFYSFQQILQLRNWKWIPIYVLTTFLAFHTQYFAFSIVAAQIIVGLPLIIIRFKKDKSMFIRLFLSFAIVGLCSLPWYFKFYSALNGFKSTNGLHAVNNLTYPSFLKLVNVHLFRESPFIVTGIFLILGILFGMKKKYRTGIFILISWMFVCSTTIFALMQNGLIIAARYFLFFQPAVCLLASFGIIKSAEFLSKLLKIKYSKVIFYIFVCGFYVTLCFNHFYDFNNYFKYFRHDDTENLKNLIVELKVPFYSTGFYHPGFGYYKLPIKRTNPLRDLNKFKYVIYTVDSQMNVEGNFKFQNCDFIFLPFQGVGQSYAVFKNKMSVSNYWNSAINILDTALEMAPHHKQIEDELFSVWILSGRKNNLKNLKNYEVIDKRIKKFNRQKNIPVNKHFWTVKNITPLLGWGKIEKMGEAEFRWSTRKRSALLLPVYSEKLKKLKINATVYCSKKVKYQKIKAWLGNSYLGEQKLSIGQLSFSYDVPRTVEKGERRLLLEFSNPVSPSSLGQGGDRRVLALNFQSIEPILSQVLPGNTFNVGASNSASWLGSNWSHAENWDIKPFRWLEGFKGKVFWIVSSDQAEGEWEIDLQPFNVSGKTQRVSILQNDLILTNFVLAKGWKTYNIFSPPIDSGENLLEFVFDYAVSPKEINLGGDTRKLSAAVADISRKIAEAQK